jgi:hypothetical protein
MIPVGPCDSPDLKVIGSPVLRSGKSSHSAANPEILTLVLDADGLIYPWEVRTCEGDEEDKKLRRRRDAIGITYSK